MNIMRNQTSEDVTIYNKDQPHLERLVKENSNAQLLPFSRKEYLENGKAISPQFPVLVIVDILYAHFLQSDRLRKEELHSNTINALYNG